MITNSLVFIFYSAIWFALTSSFDAVNILKAVLVSAAVLFFTRRLFEGKRLGLKSPKRYFWFLYYMVLLARECFKANLAEVSRLMRPGLPMRPGIVKVKSNLKSEAGLTFLANSITLRAGTMTVDIDRENGFIYVYCMNIVSQDIEKATKAVTEKFERVLLRVFK